MSETSKVARSLATKILLGTLPIPNRKQAAAILENLAELADTLEIANNTIERKQLEIDKLNIELSYRELLTKFLKRS